LTEEIIFFDVSCSIEDGKPITRAVVVQSGAKLGEREEEIYLWIKENNVLS